MRRVVGLLALVAVMATACGGDRTVDAGPVPERPSTTTTTSPAVANGTPTTTAPSREETSSV
ncbi:MAG: hypothetical protein M3203_09095, partial [Actinomycetota bacterium]|nr:hypothetical protein [Actinomycetota bacterium]